MSESVTPTTTLTPHASRALSQFNLTFSWSKGQAPLQYRKPKTLSRNTKKMTSGGCLLRVAVSSVLLCATTGFLAPRHNIHIRLPVKAAARTRFVRPLKLNLLDNINKNDDRNDWPKVSAPPNFITPEPKPLTITESTDLFAFATAAAGLVLRLGTGAFVLGWKIDSFLAPELDGDGKEQYSLKLGPIRLRDSSSVLDESMQPKQTLVLYENESSPYCKRVREMMNLLDITYECRPCFEANRNAWGVNSDRPLPYLFDPNTDETIFGDDEIIAILLDRYGPSSSTFDRKALWPIEFKAFSVLTSQIGNPTVTQQRNARPDNERMKPLELWGYECSPFVRPVKEKLSALGLPHRIVSCSRGSRNRDRMVENTGRFQVPFLVDANTGIEMFEGAEIVEYLEAVYTVK
jgi:glutathione S-transferase